MQPYGMQRQLVAAGVALTVFFGAFVGLDLVWWLSVTLAVTVFGIMLRLVRGRLVLGKDRVARGVSRADLDAALDALDQASARMRRLATAARVEERQMFTGIADLFEAIRDNHAQDPRNCVHTRKFIRHDMPRIVDTAETYVALAAEATGDTVPRIRALGERIRRIVPVLDKIEQACSTHDVMMLAVQIDALSHQLQTP